MLYRLHLRGADDGVVYGLKEFHADHDEGAAAAAVSLVGEQPYWWDGQRLLVELEPIYQPAHERAEHDLARPAEVASLAEARDVVSLAGVSS